jgi:spore germination cell wall hydrolase CwlJ-like protein
LYYHADYVSPGWRNKEKIVKIGAHIFYRPKGERT